jgi:GNAT superfamily N-acetyltransferase
MQENIREPRIMSSTVEPSIEFRPATEADLADEFAVFVAAQEELHSRRGAAWSASPFDPSGRWAQVHRHLLAHDGQRAFVAVKQDRIVGFTAALVRDDCWFFSALFIDPACQGQGIGRQLLDLAWGGPHQRRITITEAIQPVSNGLYARRGLLPVTPMLGFIGRPAIDVGAARALQSAAPTPEALRAIDLAAYGFDRTVDHEFWGRTSSRATVWLRDGQPCAYSYRGLFGIGPVAGLDAESAAQALRRELAASVDEEIRVDIPGTATALLEVALEARLSFTDPGLLLLSPSLPLPTALAIHSYWLL